MRALWCLSLACVFFGYSAGAGESTGKVVLDVWQSAQLPSGRAGHVHTTVRQLEREGKKLYRTTMELNLSVKRFDDVIQLRMESGTEETADGRVQQVFMTQYQGPGKTLNIVGTVRGKQLELVLNGKKKLKSAPWDEDVIGQYRQQTLFRDRKVKPGETFTYRSFEPTINLVVTTRVHVKDYQEVVIDGVKKRLLRVEAVPDKVGEYQLPTLTSWLDNDWAVVRSQAETPPLGLLTLVKTTRTRALSPGTKAELVDLGTNSFIRLGRRINRPYDTTSAVYRITYSGQDDPATLFVRDGRQQVKSLKSNSFEMHVRSVARPRADAPPAKAGPEFLESNYYINCSDKKVKELARRAVGAEKEPWKKALRIERWVNKNMKTNNDQALVPADQVARSLEGDCTEFAMLTAAMCRAEGVPSRTALGLIYADVPGGPVMAFHMWTEVCVKNQWIGLDATLGKGFVGASHLKITDHSWHDTQSLTPILPVVRVLGKLSIEVISVGSGS
jgi:predicted transglutaminase-like cysteine proteinase